MLAHSPSRCATWVAYIATVLCCVFLLDINNVEARQFSCASKEEKHALDMRVLQTELMIAALSCNQDKEYNRFIERYQAILQRRSEALIGLFGKLHGPSARTELNSFVTDLANQASQLSIESWEGYCDFTQNLFDKALATLPENSVQFTDQPWISNRHGFAACDDMHTAIAPSQ